ncbi:hypothetical protein [Tenuifilum osseticum]|uniref:hypothetical protein n=1 Tax=Tenuifilum osseticum TaxID=3374723 RepID=UPI0034E4DC26
MDAGDFIYILIAIALAILNAFANSKKKKAAEQKRQAQTSAPADDDLIAKKLQELLGQEVIVENEEQPLESTVVNEEEKYIYEYSSKPEDETLDRSVEFEKEPIDKPLTEEELYPVQPPKPIDTSTPIDIAESKVEGPIGDFSYQDSFNESMHEVEIDAPDAEELENVKKVEEEKEPLLADFDPLKAVVYAEIIRPKYF